jgi:hypothetical protein
MMRGYLTGCIFETVADAEGWAKSWLKNVRFVIVKA